MIDIKTIESYDGGELLLSGNAITPAYGFINMPYIALFGGNVEASTPSQRVATEQNFDWWGNAFLPPKIQYNSLTERTLNTVALNSSGRILIEQAVKRDLKFMEAFADVKVAVSIVGVDRVNINIKLTEYANQQVKEFVFLWDGTLKDLTEGNTGGGTTVVPALVQPFRYGNGESEAPELLMFGDSYPNTGYTGIVLDIDGVDIGPISKFTNRMEVSAGIFGGRLPWISIYQTPNANFRTGEIPLSAGTHTIPFTAFTTDYTIICFDIDKTGADFSQVNATKTATGFQVTMSMAGTIGYLCIKTGAYSNMRTGTGTPGPLVFTTPLTMGAEFVALYMPLSDGYGNSILDSVDYEKLVISQGIPVEVNYLVIEI